MDAMLAAGLVAEVQGLLQSGVPADCKPLQAIGYKEVVAYLQGEYDQAEMTRLIKRNTRHFAKRQLTWFRLNRQCSGLHIRKTLLLSILLQPRSSPKGEKYHVQSPL